MAEKKEIPKAKVDLKVEDETTEEMTAAMMTEKEEEIEGIEEIDLKEEKIDLTESRDKTDHKDLKDWAF